MLDHVAVVGASLAGLRVVEALRREGFEGRITVIGAEDELPYDRPPLSKQFLVDDWEDEKLAPKTIYLFLTKIKIHILSFYFIYNILYKKFKFSITQLINLLLYNFL